MRLFPGLTSCAIASGAILLAVSPCYADELARITNIQLRTLGDGVQLILITDGPKIPDVFQSTVDNTLFVDIVGAQLALPDGNRFQADNPMISVESIVIRQVRDREIQIQIAGDAENLPKVYLDRAPEALLLDVASTVPSDPFDEPSADTGDTLRIIVSADPLPRYEVTRTTIGTRTETDILDIPQNVGEITEDVIDDQGSRTLGEALRNTSGVLTGRAGSGSRATTPIVRGFETDNLLRNGLRDDTLRLSVGLNNIERVEVLKGPTSVLYGPGNLGGTVNLVTKVPKEDPRYDIELLAGNDSRYGASIDLTGPLDDFISYRLTGTYENRDSFQNFENTEFYFIAPTLELIKTEQTSLIFDFEYLNSRTDETAPGVPAISSIGVDDNTLFDNIISSGATISEEELKRAGTLDVRANLGEPEISNSELDISRVSYRLSHEFSDTWQIKNEFLASFQNTYEDNSVVGVGFAQIDGQPNLNLLDRVYLENPNFRKVYTLNTNVIGNFPIAGIPQTLLAGVEWFVETEEDQITQRLFLPFLSPDSDPFNIFIQNYDPSRFFPGNNDNVRPGTDSFRRTSNVGFYGQTQLELTEQILVTLGGRLDFADQFFEDKANRADTSPINTNDTAFSPRVGLVFKPTSNISIYANYTTSFNPVIGRSEEGELFTPETGTQWEGGIKGRFFDERITATLAAFRLRRNNVLTQDPTNPGFQVQVGEQGSDGIEFDIAGELIPGLNLIASYAYIDARILEDNEFPSGRGLLNVPKNAASFWSTYEIQGGSLEGLGFGFGLLFVGDRNGDLRTPFVIPGYTRADAALYYRRGDFRAQLNIQNLFDARYFEGARDQFRVNPGAPFTIFGTLAVELK